MSIRDHLPQGRGLNRYDHLVQQSAAPKVIAFVRDRSYRRALTKAAHRSRLSILFVDAPEQVVKTNIWATAALIVDESACTSAEMGSLAGYLERVATEIPVVITGSRKQQSRHDLLSSQAVNFVPRAAGAEAALALTVHPQPAASPFHASLSRSH